MATDPRRFLPSVATLAAGLVAQNPDLPVWAVTEAVRRVVAAARSDLAEPLRTDPVPAPPDGLSDRARDLARTLARRHPRRVINATGIILHTNLGRAPIPEGAAEAAREVAAGYSDLELDLASGSRGSRHGALADKLRELSGAESAYACNNNAAAVMLGLDTLARGREVIISRGELVEIGGSFRVPDIMERAGVALVAVGTTNRTHARDYERAIGPATGLLLKVHRSNFSQTGFVKEVSLEDLVALGRAHGLPVMEDLGSGTLIDLVPRGFPADSYVPARLRTGLDLLCFSGDKLLGGPQAGILLGTASVMERIRENPLARALRLDKMSLAALDWTLDAYLGGRAETEIPVLRQLLARPEMLEARARALAEALGESLERSVVSIAVEPDRAPVGGGSLPGFELDTFVVALRAVPGQSGFSATRAAAALRAAPVPVLARVRDAAVLLDLRTLGEDEQALVVAASREIAPRVVR